MNDVEEKQCAYLSLKRIYSKTANHHLNLPWVVVFCSNLRDHHSKNNHEKVWNIVRITKMWCRDGKWANAVGKNGTNRLAWCKIATNLPSVKNTVCVRRDKTRAACTSGALESSEEETNMAARQNTHQVTLVIMRRWLRPFKNPTGNNSRYKLNHRQFPSLSS